MKLDRSSWFSPLIHVVFPSFARTPATLIDPLTMAFKGEDIRVKGSLS